MIAALMDDQGRSQGVSADALTRGVIGGSHDFYS